MKQDQLFPCSDLVVRKDGTVTKFNAGDAVAAMVSIFALYGIRIPSSMRARLGRNAKMLLEEDKYSPEAVVTALTQTVRRGRSDRSLTEALLLERQMREKGLFVEYRGLSPRETAESAGPHFEAAVEEIREFLFGHRRP